MFFYILNFFSLREADVNEDPGVDVTSIRMFRHHMENQNQDYKSARAPEFNSIDCKPHGKFHLM